MVYLKRLSLEDGEDIYQMLQEIELDDHGFGNKAKGMTYEQFREWLSEEYAADNGRLADWMVPQSSYWLYDNNTPVGYGRVRHYLNDHLRQHSGHIGYAVPSSQRGKGYGHRLLALLKKACAQLEIDPIQLSANVDNERSNRVIVKGGGVLFETRDGKNFYTISNFAEGNYIE